MEEENRERKMEGIDDHMLETMICNAYDSTGLLSVHPLLQRRRANIFRCLKKLILLHISMDQKL